MTKDITVEELWEAQTKQHINDLKKENEKLREILEYLCDTSMELLGAAKHSNSEWFDRTSRYTDAYLKATRFLK